MRFSDDLQEIPSSKECLVVSLDGNDLEQPV